MIHRSKKKGTYFGVKIGMTASRASPLNENYLSRRTNPEIERKPYTDNMATQFSIQKRRKETFPYLARTKLETKNDQITGKAHWCQISSLKAKLSRV